MTASHSPDQDAGGRARSLDLEHVATRHGVAAVPGSSQRAPESSRGDVRSVGCTLPCRLSWVGLHSGLCGPSAQPHMPLLGALVPK